MEFEHKICVKKDAIPVIHKVRNLPFSIREGVKEHLEKLLQDDIIEKVESAEWVAPMVVKRPNGRLRLCIDLRDLNESILVDQYPLPRINEMLACTKGIKYFSTIDLKAAYHQVLLHPESRSLTTFVTPFGCFRSKRVPFGLASAAEQSRVAEHFLYLKWL